MQKKVLLMLCASLLAVSTTFAQKRNCGTMHRHETMLTQHPELIDEYAKAEKEALKWEKDNAGKTRVVVTIPVVVHVVYNTTTQNISDAQINSQIKILNEDYRRTNSDASNTPSSFAGAAADCEIEFCLATKDPNGNTTTGIIRKSTSVSSFTDDSVKSSSTGGSDAWDRNKYLNIWVCNLSGVLLGYAQFPGGPASTDGVVIGYKFFGNVGTLQSPYNLGRTATHEVGHWLGLRHIWGDDNGACTGTDQIADTPNQGDFNGSCPSFPLTDNCTASFPGVMFMNYMDYVNDNCMNMFTAGQKTKMQSILNSTRASLLTSTGCSGGSSSCVGLPAPVIQGFESSAFPPTSPGTWQVLNPDNSMGWERTTAAAFSSTASTFINNFDYTSGVGKSDDIVSPVIKAPASNPRITFDCAYTYYQGGSGASYDTLIIGISNDCGASFYIAASAYGPNLMTASAPQSTAFVPTANQWKSFYVDIAAYANQDVMIIFRNKSGFGNNLYLDNIGIKQGVVGIEENELEKTAQFNVYPNPSNGQFNIDYVADKAKTTTVTLYDFMGRKLIEKTFRANEGQNTFEMNNPELPKGYYLLQVGDGQKLGVRKIVIE